MEEEKALTFNLARKFGDKVLRKVNKGSKLLKLKNGEYVLLAIEVTSSDKTVYYRYDIDPMVPPTEPMKNNQGTGKKIAKKLFGQLEEEASEIYRFKKSKNHVGRTIIQEGDFETTEEAEGSNDAPGEETKVAEPPGEETKVTEPPGEETKVTEPPGEETKVTEPPGEETKVADPVTPAPTKKTNSGVGDTVEVRDLMEIFESTPGSPNYSSEMLKQTNDRLEREILRRRQLRKQLEEIQGLGRRSAKKVESDLRFAVEMGHITSRRDSEFPPLQAVSPVAHRVNEKAIQSGKQAEDFAPRSLFTETGNEPQAPTSTEDDAMDVAYQTTIPSTNAGSQRSANALQEANKVEETTAHLQDITRLEGKNTTGHAIDLGVMNRDYEPFGQVGDTATASANEHELFKVVANKIVRDERMAQQAQAAANPLVQENVEHADEGSNIKTEAEDPFAKAFQNYRESIKQEPTDAGDLFQGATPGMSAPGPGSNQNKGPFDTFDAVVNKIMASIQSDVPLSLSEQQTLLQQLKPFYNKFRASEMYDTMDSMSKTGLALFRSPYSSLRQKSQVRADVSEKEENVGMFLHWLVRTREFKESGGWSMFGTIVSVLGYPSMSKGQIHWILTGKVNPGPDDIPQNHHDTHSITGMTAEDVDYLINTVEYKDNSSFIDYFPNQRVPVDFSGRAKALPVSLPGVDTGPERDESTPMHVSNIPDPRFTVRGGTLVKNVKVITIKNPKYDPNLPKGPNNPEFKTQVVPDVGAGAHEVQQAVERAEADRLIKGNKMVLYPAIHAQPVDAFFGTLNYQRLTATQEYYLKYYSTDKFQITDIQAMYDWNVNFMTLFGRVLYAWAGNPELIRTTPVYELASGTMVVYEYMELHELKQELLKYQLVVHNRADRVVDMLVKPDPFDKHLEEAESKAKTTEEEKAKENKLYDSNVIMFRLPEDIPATDPKMIPHPGPGTATDDTDKPLEQIMSMDLSNDHMVHKNNDVTDRHGNKVNVPITVQEIAAGISKQPATNQEVIESKAKPSLADLMVPKRDYDSKKRKAGPHVDEKLLERKRAMFSLLNTR